MPSTPTGPGHGNCRDTKKGNLGRKKDHGRLGADISYTTYTTAVLLSGYIILQISGF